MTKDEAWLIVRMAQAIGDEGIWHWVDLLDPEPQRIAEQDDKILSEAVQIAWDRMTPQMKKDLGPVPG